MTRITNTLHEGQCKSMIISRSVLLRMGNISDEIRRRNQNTHFTYVQKPFSENRDVF
jgi:hypothetical protein